MTSGIEDPAKRASKYIADFDKARQDLVTLEGDSGVRGESIKKVSDMIVRYLEDARYYLEHNKPTTSLASIAYAEGLLDALRFLELAKAKTAEQSI